MGKNSLGLYDLGERTGVHHSIPDPDLDRDRANLSVDNERSELVADLAQQVLAPGDSLVVLNPLRLRTVNDSQDAAALVGLGNDDLDRVRRGAEDAADFGDHLDGVEHVDGVEALSQEEDER